MDIAFYRKYICGGSGGRACLEDKLGGAAGNPCCSFFNNCRSPAYFFRERCFWIVDGAPLDYLVVTAVTAAYCGRPSR